MQSTQPGPLRESSSAFSAAPADEKALLEALRRGEEAAFETLVSRHYAEMLRVAMIYVADRATAEDVVQEAWLGVLRGLDRFEERASLKTWIFRILVNRARTRAQREGRTIPFSAAWNPETEPSEPAVDPGRFLDASHPRQPGHWASPPESWGSSPEERLLARETRAYIEQAIAALPPSHREVITLRDIQGWSSEAVCHLLNISEANQRVMLHRARSKVRAALERYLKTGLQDDTD